MLFIGFWLSNVRFVTCVIDTLQGKTDDDISGCFS